VSPRPRPRPRARPAPASAGEVPILRFHTTREWAVWLGRNAASSGIWMQIAKKDAQLASITYHEALEVALCHGWIDSQKRRHDAHSFLQKFTPRGPRSVWSRVNRDKAEALIAAGRMKPAGLRAVEQARANGRWDSAYDPQGRAEVPADLRAALDRDPGARAFFETLTGANRYAVLFRIQTAVRPETRARRVQQFVAMLARGETLHPKREAAS
jgi:uncharacterized protein YdeI (YjbR/CyaY-like superfamily)